MTNKVSDFYITLKLENVDGQPVRAKDVTDLKVKVFTSDINTFVEFSNITISDKEDRLYIDYDQLSDLKSGVICYTYSYKVADPNFNDKYYNSTNINYTNFYLRQTTQVGKDADLSQNEILAICDRKLLDQYKELKTLIDNTPKITVDTQLSETSENPVANKVINQKFSDIDSTIESLSNNLGDIDKKYNSLYSDVRLVDNIINLYQEGFLKEYLKDKTEFDLSDFHKLLTRLYIPSNIKIIKQTSSVFDINTTVIYIEIKDGCEELIRAFRSFYNLSAITLPASLKKIDGYIFSGCRNLKRIYFKGTLAQWMELTDGIKFENVNPDTIVYLDDYQSFPLSN